jgi:hypothetical protein
MGGGRSRRAAGQGAAESWAKYPTYRRAAHLLRQTVRRERRNINAGQKAMAFAMLFPEPAKGGRGKKLSDFSDSLSITKGHWRDLVSQARIVRRETPELAIKVRDGFPLNEA